MSEAELQREIYNLNFDIRKLNEKKYKYEYLNQKLNEIINQLEAAKSAAAGASNNLKNHYATNVHAPEEVAFNNLSSTITNQQNKLRQIMQNAKTQIDNITAKISYKKSEIERYNRKITELRMAV